MGPLVRFRHQYVKGWNAPHTYHLVRLSKTGASAWICMNGSVHCVPLLCLEGAEGENLDEFQVTTGTLIPMAKAAYECQRDLVAKKNPTIGIGRWEDLDEHERTIWYQSILAAWRARGERA